MRGLLLMSLAVECLRHLSWALVGLVIGVQGLSLHLHLALALSYTARLGLLSFKKLLWLHQGFLSIPILRARWGDSHLMVVKPLSVAREGREEFHLQGWLLQSQMG